MHSKCLQEIREKLRRLFLSTLNILNKNGMNFKEGDNMDKYHEVSNLNIDEKSISLKIDGETGI